MVRYEYMVAYAYPGGLGRIVLYRNLPIDSGECVDEVESWLRETNGYEAIALLNFQLLRTYDHAGEE